MRVNIRGGTVAHGDAPLCHTCRNATIVRGPALADEIVQCADLPRDRGRITFKVTFCTSYSDRRQASLYEMEDIAWVLRTSPRRNEIGFVRASKLRLSERHILTED